MMFPNQDEASGRRPDAPCLHDLEDGVLREDRLISDYESALVDGAGDLNGAAGWPRSTWSDDGEFAVVLSAESPVADDGRRADDEDEDYTDEEGEEDEANDDDYDEEFYEEEEDLDDEEGEDDYSDEDEDD